MAIGLPRIGTAQLPTGEVYDRDRMLAAEGYWAVRVIAASVGRSGSSETDYDYVMKNEGGAWRFIKAIGLIVTE